MGQPKFQPTPEQRSMVESMKGYGMLHADICQVVLAKNGKPIDHKTLEKHFRKELDQGAVKANSKVAQSLFQQATGAGDWKQAVPIAAIWWSKCRMRWKETVVQEHAVPTSELGGYWIARSSRASPRSPSLPLAAPDVTPALSLGASGASVSSPGSTGRSSNHRAPTWARHQTTR
jgi:hypothetical protein